MENMRDSLFLLVGTYDCNRRNVSFIMNWRMDVAIMEDFEVENEIGRRKKK